jgi:ATP-dependent DNA helicase RecG
MEIMRTSDDGFYISEQDLVLRGGGEILGVKQSGAQEFIFADLARDMELLNECNKLALKSVTNQQDHKFLIELFSQKRMLVTKEILE